MVTETAYERVLRKLRDHGCKVRERGGQRVDATCPNHEDRNPSLSVTGITGRTVIYCHGGCDTKDVVAALGLTMADLYDERRATYRYDDGRTVERYYDNRGKKQFTQTGAGPTSTLYHASRLADVPEHRHVYLVEGEADVHTIEEMGGIATTAPQGAKSFHKVNVEPLRGHRVIVVVDKDDAGDTWAKQVQEKLEPVVEKLRLVQAKAGKDASDHFAAGYGFEHFEAYTLPTADPADEPRSRRIARIRSLTYRRSELALIPPPSWLIQGITTRASLTLLSGKFGTYKSFVSIAMAASIATGKPFLGHQVDETGPVIYIAAEGASGVRGRIEAWEHTHNDGIAIPDDMLIVVGGAVNLLRDDDMAGLEELCKEVGPRLVVWDTLHRCAPGIEEDKSREAGIAIDVLSGLRENYDCTQLLNHHTGHLGVRARGSSAWEDDCDNSWVIKLAGDGEDRSATNQRTMEHRKVKDGELSANMPIGLISAGSSAYVDRKTVEPEVKGWMVAGAYAQKLDIAGVPLAFGRERLRGALKDLGVERIDNNTLQTIATVRKAPDYQPYKKPSADGFQTDDPETV